MIKESIKYIKQYYPFIKNDKKNIIGVVTTSIIITIISIFSPALISKIITFMIDAKYQKIIYILFLLAVIKVIQLLCILINTKSFYKLRMKFILNLKTIISSSIIKFDMNTISENGKGKLIQRLNDDPNRITEDLHYIKDYIFELFINFGIIIYLIYLNIYIGLIYLSSSSLLLIIRTLGIRKKIKYRELSYKEEEKSNNNITEMLSGIKDVRQLNMKDRFKDKNNNSFNKIGNLQYKADLSFDTYKSLSTSIEWISSVIIILLSIVFLKNNIMKLDTFITLFMYKKYVYTFSSWGTDLLDKLSSFNLSSKRIFEIINLNQINLDGITKEKCNGKIEFKNVTFSYKDRKILNNCNFIINENECVRLKGKSGSGKTTILNLISRLYKVNEGMILIDDKNINEYSEMFIRKNITIISQNYYLFDMSIKENFLLVNPNLTDEEIMNACKKTKIHDLIMKLPNKYDTIIGEGGYALSGGERQRIAIARTLLINSKIILFDEVTNNLDIDLVKTINELIKNLKKDHTIIIVSHNKTIDEIDKTIYINK